MLTERIGDSCFVTQGEWLDDLVFVWDLMRKYNLLDLHNLSLRLESNIEELSYKIYGESYPPFLLSKVWKLRKYDPLQYLEQESGEGFLWSAEENETEKHKIRKAFEQKQIKEVLMRYHASTEYPIQSRQAYDKLIQIKTCDLFSSKELESIQNIILSKMTKERIAIEALPSSNLRISYYNQLEEYHLKRWLHQSSADILLPAVVLGTDDPGIFMTNIYNEYARVYLHLEECGFSTMDRMNILANLQRCSHIYKFHRT